MKDPQRLEPEPDLPEATYMSPDAHGGYVSYEDYQALRKAWNTMKGHHGYRVTINSTMHQAETIRVLMDRQEVLAGIAAAKGEA